MLLLILCAVGVGAISDAGALVQKGVAKRRVSGLEEFRREMFSIADERAKNKTMEIADRFRSFEKVRRRKAKQPSVPALTERDIERMSLISTQFRADARSKANEERECLKFCKISIAVDVMFWIYQIFGINCGPVTLLVYYIFGLIVCLAEEHLDLPTAMLVLAQMSTTVGYGVSSFSGLEGQKPGLKLWHSLHSWMGVVMVNTQWDSAIDTWLWGILIKAHEDWNVPKKFLSIFMLVMVLGVSSMVYSFDAEEEKWDCVRSVQSYQDPVYEFLGIDPMVDKTVPLASLEALPGQIDKWNAEHGDDEQLSEGVLDKDGDLEACNSFARASRLEYTKRNLTVVVDEQTNTPVEETVWEDDPEEEKDVAYAFRLFSLKSDSSHVLYVQGANDDSDLSKTDVRESLDAGSFATSTNGTVTKDGDAWKWNMDNGQEEVIEPVTYSFGWNNISKNSWGARTVDRYEFRPHLTTKTKVIYYSELTDFSDWGRDFFDALYMCLMSFSSVGYGDIAPYSSWGKMLSPIMLQLGLHFFNEVKAVVATRTSEEESELWKDDKTSGKMFTSWYKSCLPDPERKPAEEDKKKVLEEVQKVESDAHGALKQHLNKLGIDFKNKKSAKKALAKLGALALGPAVNSEQLALGPAVYDGDNSEKEEPFDDSEMEDFDLD